MKCAKCRQKTDYHHTAYLLDRSRVEGLCAGCKEKVEQADLEKMTDELMERLCHAANGHCDAGRLGKALFTSLTRQHRFLQNELFMVLFHMFKNYGSQPESSYDERNQWAVTAAGRWEKVTFDPTYSLDNEETK